MSHLGYEQIKSKALFKTHLPAKLSGEIINEPYFAPLGSPVFEVISKASVAVHPARRQWCGYKSTLMEGIIAIITC